MLTEFDPLFRQGVKLMSDEFGVDFLRGFKVIANIREGADYALQQDAGLPAPCWGSKRPHPVCFLA